MLLGFAGRNVAAVDGYSSFQMNAHMESLAHPPGGLPHHLTTDEIAGRIHDLLCFFMGVLQFQLTEVLKCKNGNYLIGSAGGDGSEDACSPNGPEFIQDQSGRIPVRLVDTLVKSIDI